MALAIRLTRVSPTHHRFAFTRPDGSEGARELETRGLLLHDLIHFALETEGQLQGGLYGRIARGFDPDAEWEEGSEAATIEYVVGPLQGAQKGEVDPEAFAAHLRASFEAAGGLAPAWLTPDLIARTQTALQRLLGQWRATPFHETMTLSFQTEAA